MSCRACWVLLAGIIGCTSGLDGAFLEGLCGDGIVEGIEECDDGNRTDGDGCSQVCRTEPGWVCAESMRCTETCGDGFVDPIEACDDGNAAANDGCSSSCTIEPGWTCQTNGSLSSCVAAVACTGHCPQLDWLHSSPARVSFTKSEVTVAQFRACVDSGPCANTYDTSNDEPSCNFGNPSRDDHPMNCLDPDAASAFCTWVGGRLPTGDEWYAEASNGDTWQYPWGNMPEPSCNHAVMHEGGPGCGQGSTLAVCAKPRGNSTSGLCDLSGSLWELTNTSGIGLTLRGGGWGNVNATSLSASSHSRFMVESRQNHYGFRCARTSEDPPPVCGDGHVAQSEACDDGNAAIGDGCSSGCTLEAGWVCSSSPSDCRRSGAQDAGLSATTDTGVGSVDAGAPPSGRCGDGTVSSNEGCDDGSTRSGDGCSATCEVEAGWRCGQSPDPNETWSVCGKCGDGQFQAAIEECDDGNTQGGDGCSSTCTHERGWLCQTANNCLPICGDGLIVGSEACDDGNQMRFDGCSGGCTAVEPGWTCSGEPSVCTM